ncbi:GMC family oxidoreductase [Fluviispira multicolorata]|uniref:FAD-dependent oxidoreductase n=1 Tax=Fluviispira multicolorata TaxID=2654512 RepID=A0A833JFW7_9BACT|nr:GMC family oxidoreductase [Fluviispira multicolorata]KAB8033560.1 FAD-dependent oxidoreductase [Fluviispira multicolorata]
MSDDQLSADVVVVGSGVAGSLVAYELSRKGIKNIILLEAGPKIARQTIVNNFYKSIDSSNYMEPYEMAKHAPHPDPSKPEGYIIEKGMNRYNTQYIRAVGGTTWHWAGCTWRLVPNDFKLKSLYGVGRDWPLEYNELEPFYETMEKELGVSGELPLGSPRKSPYPMKGLAFTYMDSYIEKKLAPKYKVVLEPLAKNSVEYDSRPPCCGNNNCMPVCPIGAQYSAIVHVEKAEKNGVRLMENSVAYFIETDSNNKVIAIHVKTPTGQKKIVKGKYFVLAANGIEIPKLLLLSKSEKNPRGIANKNDLVGRFLMDHPGLNRTITLKEPIYGGRGPVELSAILEFRDGNLRKTMASKKIHFGTQVNYKQLSDSLIEQGYSGDELKEKFKYKAIRTFGIGSFHEQLPDSNNRVTLSDRSDAIGIKRPQIQYSIEDYVKKSGSDTIAKMDEIAKMLGADEITKTKGFDPNNHIMGTTIMGSSERDSVVDKYCRTHENKNLFIASSSVMPSSACVNPTGTIAALSLRIADSIYKELVK